MIKKLLTLFTLLTLSIGVGWAETTVLVNIGDYATANSWSSTNQYLSIDLDNNITATASGGSNTGKYYSSDATWRFYASENAKLIVSAANDCSLKSITLEFSTKDNGTISFGTNTLTSGTPEPVSGSSATFSIGTSSGSGGKVFITSISVTYESGSTPPEPDPITPEGTITFTPEASSAVSWGTLVEMSFNGTCSGIKYTTDGTTTPDATNGEFYDASNPPKITKATTIKARAYNYSNSKYAFGNEATVTYEIAPLERALILFKSSGGVSLNNTSLYNDIDEASKDFVDNATDVINCYEADGVIRLTSGSAAGKFTLNLSDLINTNLVKQIKVEAKGWSANETGQFSITGISDVQEVGNEGYSVKTIDVSPSETFSSITVQGVKGHRVYIKSITLIFDDGTPTPSGPEYYLVGSFKMNGNEWAQEDPDYKFSESNGTYTLTKESLPACSFKILKVDGNTKTWYGFKEGEANIHHNNHENIPTGGLGNEAAFNLQSEGYTEFSFTLDASNYDNPKFTVTRTPKLYIQGFGDFNTNVAMTQTSTGWTISKTINQYQQFRFIDEFGQRQGWTGGDYGINDINSTIPIAAGDNVFQMNVDGGDFILNVNSDVTTLNIKKAIKYQLITSTQI